MSLGNCLALHDAHQDIDSPLSDVVAWFVDALARVLLQVGEVPADWEILYPGASQRGGGNPLTSFRSTRLKVKW
ncbi:hypothetical protein AY518_07395 [Corynebacterium diphtheriae bv. gravis]|nr:hypothetical protein AY518_07395 [Corynebacterium diphtheriae bv. gravis]